MKLKLTFAAAFAAFAMSGTAALAHPGMTTGTVNMRIGPGTQHPIIVAVPVSQPITIVGRLSGSAWCDVVWAGHRGWVSASTSLHSTGILGTIATVYHRVPTVSHGSRPDATHASNIASIGAWIADGIAGLKLIFASLSVGIVGYIGGHPLPSQGCRQRINANAHAGPPIPSMVRNSGTVSAPESTRAKEDSMCAERRRARKGRPRQPVPETLPDDLFDYADEPTPDGRERRRSPLRIVDVESLPVFDDWPEKVPITEEELQIFERYFGDVLDRLFGPIDDPDNQGLQSLSSDDNSKS